MLNLYTVSISSVGKTYDLTPSEKFSILYHDLFDYPLNIADLIRWLPNESKVNYALEARVLGKRGYFVIEGKNSLIYKRVLRNRISDKKLKIAKKASKILSYIFGIKMVGITGSLAMKNSSENDDIDLIIVAKTGILWTTRIITYFVLKIMKFGLRKPNDKNQKDKLCLNIWLDEEDLTWEQQDRNFYTAHEIAQIVPLVNKDKTYEKFLGKNKWILDYWPNSVKMPYAASFKLYAKNTLKHKTYSIMQVVEKLAFNFQKTYMQNKITREVITPTRAIFHPHDWGKVVLKRLTP